jgi:hypothetical protein
MTKQLKKIKHYHSRMTTAINELEKLEYMEEMTDYNDVIFEMKWIVEILEERREWLQKHGRTQ